MKKTIKEQSKRFTELCNSTLTTYNYTLSEVQPGLFEVSSPDNRNSLFIKLLSPTGRGYLIKSDKAFLETARDEDNFAFAAFGPVDAFNCVLTYLKNELYFDCACQSMYWNHYYMVKGDNNDATV